MLRVMMWWYNQPIRCFIPHGTAQSRLGPIFWFSFISHLPLTHYVCRRIPVLSANQTPAAIFIRPTDSAASCEKSWAPEIERERLRNAQSERGCKNLHFDMNKTVKINLTWDQWTEPEPETDLDLGQIVVLIFSFMSVCLLSPLLT